jgi:single-strand DNA-binding protein
MNKQIIIGNLTRDPEYKDVNGTPCCTYTVAVNRRVRAGEHPEADYIRVTAWNMLAELCQKYLAKGRKVCVEGIPRASGWITRDNTVRAAIELRAESVEFLTPRNRDFEEAAPEDAVPPEFENEFFGGGQA